MSSMTKKCSYGDCKKNVAFAIGDCVYCVKMFCLKHRLPEDHDCNNMNVCKRNAMERNSVLLMKSKCVGTKI